MPDVLTLKNALLVVCAVFLSVTVFICLFRASLGPRYTDRITASSIIGTKVILLIAVLAMVVGNDYLVDICLIYAIINFLAVVVLARSVLEKREGEKEL
ncbi:MAG: sodium:proton antiporter [Synergistaceae bacterium]|nr:sodium:proton antiporter [Synergistaceae bacterium]